MKYMGYAVAFGMCIAAGAALADPIPTHYERETASLAIHNIIKNCLEPHDYVVQLNNGNWVKISSDEPTVERFNNVLSDPGSRHPTDYCVNQLSHATQFKLNPYSITQIYKSH